MHLLHHIVVFVFLISSTLCINVTRKTNADYYENYDYNVRTENNETIDESSLIFPMPQEINVELPDDSLADSDLKDHNFIDSLMYVYYGGKSQNSRISSWKIIIFGCVSSGVISAFALRLLMRHAVDTRFTMFPMFTAPVVYSIFSNILLILMLKSDHINPLECNLVSSFLFAQHIAMQICFSAYCYYIVRRVSMRVVGTLWKKYGISTLIYGTITGFIVSGTLELLSYSTGKICFLQTPMIACYILTYVNLMATAICVGHGFRIINNEISTLEDIVLGLAKDTGNSYRPDYRLQAMKEYQRCLKLLITTEVWNGGVWFCTTLAVVELHNDNVAAIAFTASSILLSLFVLVNYDGFVLSKDICPIINKKDLESVPEVAEQSLQSDVVPLLVDADEIAKEMKSDTICTISS